MADSPLAEARASIRVGRSLPGCVSLVGRTEELGEKILSTQLMMTLLEQRKPRRKNPSLRRCARLPAMAEGHSGFHELP